MLASILATFLLATSTPTGFIDDYDLALARAKAEKKIIVADFSGSDWCFWCQRLDREILTQEAFLSVATNRYVLLMVDSPRDKTRLSEKAKVENPKLVRKYNVTGYPTVLLLDADGKLVGETGFVGGGPENYLRHLDEKVAAIPQYVTWIKPLVKRISGFYRHYSETMTQRMKEVQGKSREESEAVRCATTLALVAELEAILAEERARAAPAETSADRDKILRDAAAGAESLRRSAQSEPHR